MSIIIISQEHQVSGGQGKVVSRQQSMSRGDTSSNKSQFYKGSYQTDVCGALR